MAMLSTLANALTGGWYDYLANADERERQARARQGLIAAMPVPDAPGAPRFTDVDAMGLPVQRGPEGLPLADPDGGKTYQQRYLGWLRDAAAAGIDPKKQGLPELADILPQAFENEGDIFGYDKLSGTANRAYDSRRPKVVGDALVDGEGGGEVYRAPYTLGANQTRFDGDNQVMAQGYIEPKAQAWDPSNTAVVTPGQAPRGAQVDAALGHFSPLFGPAGAAGLVGNLHWESGGLNPNALGDGGTAYGLAQWRNERRAGLEQFARQRGASPADPQTQLAYAAWELTEGPYKHVGQMLRNARSPEEAADIVALHYERPTGAETGVAANIHGIQERRSRAAQFAGTGAAPQSQVIPGQPKPTTPYAAPPGMKEVPGNPGFYRNALGQTFQYNSRGTLDQVMGPTQTQADAAIRKVQVVNRGLQQLDRVDELLKGIKVTDLGIVGKYITNQDDFAKLQAATTDLQMQLKSLYELGAITGPDMEILGNLIADPGAMKSAVLSGTLRGRLRELARTMGDGYRVDAKSYEALGGDPKALPPLYRSPRSAYTREQYGHDGRVKPGTGTQAPATHQNNAQLLNEARLAIAQGAPRAKVIERLRAKGVNPEGL